MKLYIYDHCPYCVRARMVFGVRQIDIEEVVLLNDDEATPIHLIGKKVVPILAKPDGSHMGESLDIVHWANEYAQHAPLQAARAEIQAWFERINQYCHFLMMPRDIHLGLPEFATPEAVAYFVHKKEAQWNDTFANMLNDTPKYLAQAHADLQTLATLTLSPQWLNGEGLSIDDVLVFPILRNLTMVKGIEFPEILLNYLHHMAKRSGVDLFFDRAL